MKEHPRLLDDIGQEILSLLQGYVQAQSITNSAAEKSAEVFFTESFARLPYFQHNPEFYGRFPIQDDAHGRSVCYAMVCGTGPETVVLLHHFDVVSTEDFKLLEPYAFSPNELAEKLYDIRDTLSGDVQQDLESGNWLFGRGVCDMKGGGAIQMALLNRYSQLENFTGNVIVLGLPDEENLSAGMRAAAVLLDNLQQQYGLSYKLAIDSESHQRSKDDTGILSLGSVGKVMPFVYVRGFLAHSGKVFEGMNPLGIMSEVVTRVEVNMALADVVPGESAPPPTWLYLRDNKPRYDVSMPLSVLGCFSLLTLHQSPPAVMDAVRRICNEAFADVLDRMNKNYSQFLSAHGQAQKKLPWQVKVVDFSQLYDEAAQAHGDTFVDAYDALVDELGRRMATQPDFSLINCHNELLEFVFDYIDDLSPCVVFGLIPPYYPEVSFLQCQNLPQDVASLPDTLRAFSQSEYGQTYDIEQYYTGISDLSYTSLSDADGIDAALRAAMPLYQRLYSLPLESIERISMPSINIGPWGKDLHQMTERVLLEDLTLRTPALVHKAVFTLLPQ